MTRPDPFESFWRALARRGEREQALQELPLSHS